MDNRDINLRAPGFLLGRTTEVCGHCGSTTAVFALALARGHSLLTSDDQEEDGSGADEPGLDTWQIVTGNALLYHVEGVGAGVRSQLERLAPSFHCDINLGDGNEAPGGGWLNHCGRCQAALDDHELFCEPGGAFLPTSVEAARRIEFLSVESSFEASAAGYAYEPAFVVFPV